MIFKVLYACSLNTLGNSNIIYHFQACLGNTCEIAWVCSEEVLKRVQWNSCKLWRILPDEDYNFEFKYKNDQAKEKFKNYQHTLKKYRFNIEDDKKRLKYLVSESL